MEPDELEAGVRRLAMMRILVGVVGCIYRFSPTLRRSIWKWWYEYLASRYRAAQEWTFMNYGFVDLTGAQRLHLSAEDERERYCIQLYDHVAGAVDLRGRDVLEVGSGRGGGASYVMRYLQPKSLTGVDFAEPAIRFCQQRHRVPGLAFIRGDAGNLPFPENEFDVVLNVESSHCYPSMETFVAEVKRVLRPNGFFLFADLRPREDIPLLRRQLLASGFEMVREEQITPGVIKALDEDEERRRSLIQQKVPRLLRGVFKQFAGLTGTAVYESFRNNRLIYLNCVLRKAVS